MSRAQLKGGAYRAASVLANAQRCVNLYPEKNPEESQPEALVTHYQRPGLRFISNNALGNVGFGRCLYTATNGDLYAVVNQQVFYINPDFIWTSIGSLVSGLNTPVSMSDNGTTIVVVDNSNTGAFIDMATRAFALIGDPNFLGSIRTDFLDGFLVFAQPNSPNWYCTDLYSTVFNAISFGTKTAWPDNIKTIIAVEREIWIMGAYKSEVWFNSGTIPFPFSAQPGLIIEHGISAPYSIAKQDVYIFWLSQSPEGARMVMKNKGHVAERISTHALEAEMLTYRRVDDAIGTCFQIRGHGFYMLHFPTADRTWIFDVATDQWSEWAFFDPNGVQRRMRCSQVAYAYSKNLALDWQTGFLYELSDTHYWDDITMGGNDDQIHDQQLIKCVRTFPIMLDTENSVRLTLWKVIADIETGTFSSGSDDGVPAPNTDIFGLPPFAVHLAVSRDRGRSFASIPDQSIGSTGEYRVKPTWNRLGMFNVGAVLEFSWAAPQAAAFSSAFVEFEKHEGDQ